MTQHNQEHPPVGDSEKLRERADKYHMDGSIYDGMKAALYVGTVRDGATVAHCPSYAAAIELMNDANAGARTPAQVHDAAQGLVVELERYDAGLFNDFGGGNIEWWWDYIRSELDRAHDFYADQFANAITALRSQVQTASAKPPQASGVDGLVEVIAQFVERWNGETAEGNTFLIASEIREQFGASPVGPLVKCPSCGTRFQQVHDVDAHLAALRTCPDTEQVRQENERVRWITLWRKTGEQCLDWDFHVSEFADDVARVVANLKAQGVWQFTTYQLGALVDEHSNPPARAALASKDNADG